MVYLFSSMNAISMEMHVIGESQYSCGMNDQYFFDGSQSQEFGCLNLTYLSDSCKHIFLLYFVEHFQILHLPVFSPVRHFTLVHWLEPTNKSRVTRVVAFSFLNLVDHALQTRTAEASRLGCNQLKTI